MKVSEKIMEMYRIKKIYFFDEYKMFEISIENTLIPNFTQ